VSYPILFFAEVIRIFLEILNSGKRSFIKIVNEGCEMEVKKGFFGGFLVLGFVIFIIGLLAGMLAILLVSSKLDSSVLFMVFSLGFIIGMIVVALIWVIVKFKELKTT
jgi:flagellar biogenesis protein FliO